MLIFYILIFTFIDFNYLSSILMSYLSTLLFILYILFINLVYLSFFALCSHVYQFLFLHACLIHDYRIYQFFMYCSLDDVIFIKAQLCLSKHYHDFICISVMSIYFLCITEGHNKKNGPALDNSRLLVSITGLYNINILNIKFNHI